MPAADARPKEAKINLMDYICLCSHVEILEILDENLLRFGYDIQISTDSRKIMWREEINSNLITCHANNKNLFP